jgi:hypothetical protein
MTDINLVNIFSFWGGVFLIFVVLIIVFLSIGIEQRRFLSVKKRWRNNLSEISGLVSVYQGDQYDWLRDYSFYAYRNGIDFRKHLNQDTSSFRLMQVSIEIVLDYRIYAMKLLIVESVFMRFVTEIFIANSTQGTLIVDFFLMILTMLCWIASGQIAWGKSPGKQAKWRQILVGSYYDFRAYEYWKADASLFGQEHKYYLGIETLSLERLKNFYAVAQMILLIVFILSIIMGNSSRIAPYIN